MRVGLFRRFFATSIDTYLLMLVVWIIYSLVARNIFINQFENYDELTLAQQESLDEYSRKVDALDLQLTTNEISQEKYNEEVDILTNQYSEENNDFAVMQITLLLMTILFLLFSWKLFNFFYNLAMKGQTVGRRIMKIRLEGKITWLSIFVREFLYKGFIFIPIDVGLIAFTKSKKTIRDHVSKTRIVHDGVKYPF